MKNDSLTKGQISTISPEATKIIRGFSSFSLPSFMKIGPRLLKLMRKNFNVGENKIENEIIERYHLKLENIMVNDVPVLTITPNHINPKYDKMIALYIHGGAFVLGSARERTALLMAAEMGIRVYSIEYTLAPEATFPTAIHQCLAVIKSLLTEFGAANIIGLSTSSGGTLMLATLLKARELKLPMIKAMALFSPAVDISGDGDSAVFNNKRDVMPSTVAMKLAHPYYVVDADLHDPLVSPLYGEYDSHFPPTIVVTGTRDIMLSGCVQLVSKFKAAHVPVDLTVAEGMWHGFFWFPDLPEAIAARKVAADFLSGYMQGADNQKNCTAFALSD
jgi:Esterase/lipase